VQEFVEDHMTVWAAALTYYGLLSLFPALLALVSIVGLVADPVSTTKNVTEIVTGLGPKSAADALAGPIRSITSNRGGAGLAFIGGLAIALWSASGYIGTFMQAANVIYETPEGRSIWKRRPLQLLVTLIMVILTVLVALALVLTGPVVRAVAAPLGLSDTAVTVWDVAKWPVMVLVVLTMISLLYYAAPNVAMKQRGVRWVTKGALLALVVWLVASAAFAFFVANFGSYNKTYGTLAGLIVVLVWLWLTNIALLLGLELNSERERGIELAEGVSGAAQEIQLEPRSEPKPRRTT
nr:YihY/virulence factor BrkB family protein [Sporichthyaceae bacterium]